MTPRHAFNTVQLINQLISRNRSWNKNASHYTPSFCSDIRHPAFESLNLPSRLPAAGAMRPLCHLCVLESMSTLSKARIKTDCPHNSISNLIQVLVLRTRRFSNFFWIRSSDQLWIRKKWSSTLFPSLCWPCLWVRIFKVEKTGSVKS